MKCLWWKKKDPVSNKMPLQIHFLNKKVNFWLWCALNLSLIFHSDWPAHLVSWMLVCLNPQGDAFLLGAGCGTKLIISPASPPKRSRAPGWHIGKTRASLSGSGAHQAFIAQWIRVLPPAYADTMSLSRQDQSGSGVGTLLLQFG